VDVVLQQVCAGVAVSHGGLPSSPLVTGIVQRALAVGPVTAPTAADCAALSS
jgi:hypothetical protein